MSTIYDRRVHEAVKERILSAGEGRVRKIILYGSRVQGGATEDSDLDVLVVEADPIYKRKEKGRFRQLFRDLAIEVDVWVMGEREFEETKNVVGGLAYPAHKYGVVLNEDG